MLPKTHIFLGAVFSLLFWILFPETAWYNVSLIFLSSFAIDFDHYMCAVLKNKSLSLPKALKYYKEVSRLEKVEFKRGIFRRGNFHVFHTIEFNALILAIGFVFQPFLYILLGMVMHESLDIIDMTKKSRLYRREFLLINWVREKL